MVFFINIYSHCNLNVCYSFDKVTMMWTAVVAWTLNWKILFAAVNIAFINTESIWLPNYFKLPTLLSLLCSWLKRLIHEFSPESFIHSQARCLCFYPILNMYECILSLQTYICWSASTYYIIVWCLSWWWVFPAAVPCIQEPGPGMWRPVVSAFQPVDKRQLGCFSGATFHTYLCSLQFLKHLLFL